MDDFFAICHRRVSHYFITTKKISLPNHLLISFSNFHFLTCLNVVKTTKFVREKRLGLASNCFIRAFKSLECIENCLLVRLQCEKFECFGFVVSFHTHTEDDWRRLLSAKNCFSWRMGKRAPKKKDMHKYSDYHNTGKTLLKFKNMVWYVVYVLWYEFFFRIRFYKMKSRYCFSREILLGQNTCM